MSMQRHNFYLDADVVEALKAHAKERRCSMAQLIREILVEYLKTNGKL